MKNKGKYKNHTEETTIDIGNRPQISVTLSHAIQDILLQKKKTIQTAFDELSDLSIKTNSEYDKIK